MAWERDWELERWWGLVEGQGCSLEEAGFCFQPPLSTSQPEEPSPACPTWSSAQLLPSSASLAVPYPLSLGCGSVPAYKPGARRPWGGCTQVAHVIKHLTSTVEPSPPGRSDATPQRPMDSWRGRTKARSLPRSWEWGLSFSVGKRTINSRDKTNGAELVGTEGFL